MKKLLFTTMAVLITVTVCNSCTNNKTKQKTTSETHIQPVDSSVVYVYYFHGKQRCKTCIAVGKIAEQTIKNKYTNNAKVKFIEIQTDKKINTSLIEKYEVTWNALIIAKGNNHTEITKQAFAYALNSPEDLESLIESEVDKRIL